MKVRFPAAAASIAAFALLLTLLFLMARPGRSASVLGVLGCKSALTSDAASEKRAVDRCLLQQVAAGARLDAQQEIVVQNLELNLQTIMLGGIFTRCTAKTDLSLDDVRTRVQAVLAGLSANPAGGAKLRLSSNRLQRAGTALLAAQRKSFETSASQLDRQINALFFPRYLNARAKILAPSKKVGPEAAFNAFVGGFEVFIQTFDKIFPSGLSAAALDKLLVEIDANRDGRLSCGERDTFFSQRGLLPVAGMLRDSSADLDAKLEPWRKRESVKPTVVPTATPKSDSSLDPTPAPTPTSIPGVPSPLPTAGNTATPTPYSTPIVDSSLLPREKQHFTPEAPEESAPPLVSGPTAGCAAPPGFYQIRTADDLQFISEAPSENYYLCNDIDLTGKTSKPLGPPIRYCITNDDLVAFKGVFEGNSKRILNLYIPFIASEFSPHDECAALFKVNQGTIRNVTLVNPHVEGNFMPTGSIVGYNQGLVENVSVEGGFIWAPSFVGGLVGMNTGTVRRASITGTTVSSPGRYAAGFAWSNTGVIESTFGSQISVIGDGSVGGMTTYTEALPYGGTFSNSFVTGTVTSNNSAGGVLASQNSGGVLSHLYTTVKVNSPSSVVGAFAAVSGPLSADSASYYNSQINPGMGGVVGIGRTTLEMTTVPSAIYAGWDFTSIWQQGNGEYPTLRPKPRCTADIDGSGVVDNVDLGVLSRHWQGRVTPNSLGDLSGDGLVNISDLRIFSTNFGVVCPARTFTITASAGANGTISPAGANSVLEGSYKTFTISPNPGYFVDRIIIDGVSVAGRSSYTFSNIDSNKTIVASFLPIYTITASAGAHGSVTPAGATSVLSGATQEYSITPDSGYRILDLLVDGVAIPVVSNYWFNNVSANHTIEAHFAPPPQCLGDANGDGTVNDGDLGVLARAWQRQVTPGSEADFNNDGRVDISDLRILSSHYGACPSSYTITASVAGLYPDKGTISPSGNVVVSAGGSQTFNFSTQPGYSVVSVIINGEYAGTPGSYTFNNVRSDQTIEIYIYTAP